MLKNECSRPQPEPDRYWRLLGGCLVLGGLLLSLGLAYPAQAAEHPILYFFWGQGCPHCQKEKEFLRALHQEYPELEMRWFEPWNHPRSRQLVSAMRQAYGEATTSVPQTYIGRWSTTGFIEKNTGPQMEEQVLTCLRQGGCVDPLAMIGPRRIAAQIRAQAAQQTPENWEWFPATAPPRTITAVPPTPTPAASSQPTEGDAPEKSAAQAPHPLHKAETIAVPLLGDISVSQTGLPVFTLIIAGLDGFNPCAMWVLCFLLTLVIYAKSRAKILLIGGIFVVASGVMYFLFMTAWLNLFMFIGYVKILRIAVALVAIGMGLINCKDFFFFKQGISLTIPEAAQPKLFKKMRALIQTTAVPAVILGTLVLAATANLIELLCTAGFPAIYTRILTLQDNLSVVQYYLYLAFYNVVYVIPLAVIVGMFAWKMGGRKLTEREGRILKLIGGVLMLALGVILLVKPHLLMFG